MRSQKRIGRRRVVPAGHAPDSAPRPLLEAVERRLLLAADIVLDGGNLTVTGTEGNDVMSVVRVGIDDVQVTVNALTRRLDMDDIDSYGMFGLGGNDEMTLIGSVRVASAPGFVMNGGAGEDTARGTELLIRQCETVRDEAGRFVASRVFGTGQHQVHGTEGADTITLTEEGGDGAQLIINDSFHGYFSAAEFGDWAVFAKGGNDTVRIGLFFPEVTVFGADGNDVVDKAEASSVAFEGGNGDDLLRARGETYEGVPYFFGEDGTDTVEMADQRRLDLTATGPGGVLAFAEIENVTNAQGTVIGNTLNNRITVRAGDTAGVEVRAGDGDDTVIGGPGPDRLFGEAGHDTLFGNGANDLLDGGPGIDLLDGGPGSDILVNGENNAGPRFFIDARKLNVVGTLGADTFSLVRIGVDDVLATVNGVSRRFDLDDFDSVDMAGGPGNDAMTLGNGISNVRVIGGTGDDRITGNDRSNEILGEGGNDTVNAGGGDDQVAGGDGNDTVNGGSGADFLFGGPGNDTLTGGAGVDDMHGEGGDDTLFARDGEVELDVDGGPGFDRAQVDGADPRDGIEQILA